MNALRPHPWVWMTVGAPILAQAGAASGAGFLAVFHLLLVGTKVASAAALDAGRERLVEGRGYTILLRGSAVLLPATGVLLAVEGLRAQG